GPALPLAPGPAPAAPPAPPLAPGPAAPAAAPAAPAAAPPRGTRTGRGRAQRPERAGASSPPSTAGARHRALRRQADRRLVRLRGDPGGRREVVRHTRESDRRVEHPARPAPLRAQP